MRRLLVSLLVLTAAAWARPSFPYREAGLTPRQAAAHLLSRFTFGARPGEVDRVVAMGLENWFARQLAATAPENYSEDLRPQKLMRAVRSEAQLSEVMTDFWFNHFNVSTNSDGGEFVLSYERTAIRPFALGTFRQLLGSTSHHAAMLRYLNNANSTAGDPRDLEQVPAMRGGPIQKRPTDGLGYGPPKRGTMPPVPIKNRGINENYARELLELHTLGVDGGYSQKDVVEVARALTGWGLEGPSFRFRPQNHDFGAKVVLRQRFPAGQGQAEGEKILDLLAAHPSTARHLATKLACRFVCDDPPKELVQHLATRFGATDGDIREVLWDLAASPAFWDPKTSLRAKIKSPFELVASAVRTTGAQVSNWGPLVNWIETMGQPLYAYQAPTGFPDKAEFWINSGLLLHRMNFGAQFPSLVKVDLSPYVAANVTTPEDTVRAYAAVLLPERDLGPLVAELAESARDPQYAARVAEAAKAGKVGKRAAAGKLGTSVDAANVIGVLLGSPEFQRR